MFGLSRMQAAALAARLDSRSHVIAAGKIHLTPDAQRKRFARGLARLSVDQRARYIAALRKGGRAVRVRPMPLSFAAHLC